MKRLNPDILIGLLLASLFWVGVFVWQSSQPPNRASETSQHCEGTKSECAKAATDERIADYTWWLALLTGALVTVSAVQGYFLLRSDKTARIAANAADRSARAAIALQLPVIRIVPNALSQGDGLADGKPYENCSVHFVTISNLGTTKAFPKEILYGWTVGNDLPSEPSYQWIDSFLPNYFIEPDPKITPRKFLVGTKMLEPGQRTEISKGNYLWFYCALLYDDFMGEAHSHGFCWRWSYTGHGLGWRIDGTPAYNRKT
jgi:hypothetical protein